MIKRSAASCDWSSLETSCVWTKSVAVVSKITSNCVEQVFSVIISVVSVTCEQWNKSRENNKEFNWNKRHICFYLVCNKRTYIKAFLKGKNVTICLKYDMTAIHTDDLTTNVGGLNSRLTA